MYFSFLLENNLPIPNVNIGPLLDDRLKENLKNPETLKGCPLFSLSCLSVSELQSTPFDLGT